MARALTPHEELYRRAIAYVDRRAGALIRRGGRGGSGRGGKPGFDAGKLYAIGGFSAANRYVTPGDGGEPGTTTGFVSVELVRLNSLSAAPQIFGGRSGGASGGYFHTIDASSGLRFYAKSTSGFPSSPIRTLLPSDVGKVFCVIGLHTGGGALVRQWVDRAEIGTGTSASGYTAENSSSIIGALVTGAQPATGLSWLAGATFRGVPTPAQIEAFFDQVRILGDLPVLMPTGDVTISHRWSLRDVLAAERVPVLDGDLAPASLPDTVTGAAINAMMRQGAPVVRRIDPGVDGRVTFGALGFSATNILRSAGSVLPGVAGAFFRIVRFRLDALPTAANYLFGQSNDSNAGWQLFVGGPGLNYAPSFRLANNLGAFVIYVGTPFVAADVGQTFVLGCMLDGSNARLFLARQDQDAAELGGGLIVAGYTPHVGPLTVGLGSPTGTQPAASLTIFDSQGGDVAIASASLLETMSAMARTGRQVSAADSEHAWDPYADIIAHGGPSAGMPAQVLDRIGTDHLTRVGTGLQVAQRTERLWSYETTPIFYGVAG